MNITPINFALSLNKTNLKNNNTYKSRELPFDSVSFSGKKIITPEEFSKEAQEAISLGKKLLKMARSNSLTKETLWATLNEKSPVVIAVEDIRNCPVQSSATSKVVAHMLPMYNQELKLAGANIYLSPLPKTSKEETDFIANVAHEYSHVLQRVNDENYYGILNYTKNVAEITTIARTAQSLMNEMIKMCQQKLFKNEKDVKLVLESILNKKFNAEKSLNGINFDEITDFVSTKLAQQLDKAPQDMKKAIKGWIIQETHNEKEAYRVTLDMLERSKNDPDTKARRTLSKETFAYINKKLQEM